ncbi:MAG: hypothetical protein QOG64_746 [Acidimicrobiaceae bacterium]|nr:hypothetical protein [Acidimicrobiaceae bacterium]
MTPTSLSDTTIFETPNATMRTYASPSSGGAAIAVWRTEMATAAAGPEHVVDVDQVVVVIAGRLQILIDGTEHAVAAGDSAIVRAGSVRQLRNAGNEVLVTLTAAQPGGRARVGANDPVDIPWAR